MLKPSCKLGYKIREGGGTFAYPPTFAQFWSLRGAKRRGNLVAYQCVMRMLCSARNDNTGVVQRSQEDYHG